MPKSHRVSAPPPRDLRGPRPPRSRSSFGPAQQAGFLATPAVEVATGPIRVMVALLDARLSGRVCAHLSRHEEFVLVEDRDSRLPPPEVVVVDFTPGTGVPSVHGASSARPVALSRLCDDETYLSAVEGGAWALLPERPSPFEVTAAIRQVAAGECPILSQIARRPSLAGATFARLRASASLRNPLSAREAAILAQVARGAKNGVIGAIFGLQEQTVKNYLSEILKKTGTGNRAEAAALAVRHGWLEAGQA